MPSKPFRVALVGLYHESNTFLSQPTTLQNFKDSHFIMGESIRAEYAEAYHEIGGILEVFDASDVEIVPLVFAEATPGGVIDQASFDYLVELILKELQAQGPWDGIMACAHGAAVAQGYPDSDGYWISKVRELVGKDIPIVSTLDPHANISPLMGEATQAMIAYRTNPHLDQRETGKKAATLLLQILLKKIQPVQIVSQTKVSISIEQQYTQDMPCKALYDYVDRFIAHEKVCSISVILGFPYSDVEKMGSGFVVVTDDDQALAMEIGQSLRAYLEQHCHDFVGDKKQIPQAMAALPDLPKPVLLLDMGDNVGGGSPGDSTHLLSALVASAKYRFFYCVYDPPSVAQCRHLSVGDRVDLSVGGKSDQLHGQPIQLSVVISGKYEGVFKEKAPRHGGQVQYNMGATVCVTTDNDSMIMLISKRVPPFSLSQLTTFGIQVQDYEVVVAKGVQAPIAAYGPEVSSILRVDTPGVTRADATQLRFHHRRKPLFPFENISDATSI